MPEQGHDYVQRGKVPNIIRRFLADFSVFALIIGGFVLADMARGWSL